MTTWADERRYWTGEKRTLWVVVTWLVILGALLVVFHSLPGISFALLSGMLVVISPSTPGVAFVVPEARYRADPGTCGVCVG